MCSFVRSFAALGVYICRDFFCILLACSCSRVVAGNHYLHLFYIHIHFLCVSAYKLQLGGFGLKLSILVCYFPTLCDGAQRRSGHRFRWCTETVLHAFAFLAAPLVSNGFRCACALEYIRHPSARWRMALPRRATATAPPPPRRYFFVCWCSRCFATAKCTRTRARTDERGRVCVRM